MYMPGVQNNWWAQEEKRNMATQTAQFKIKRGLKQEEWAKVAYANFSKWMYQLGIKHVRETDFQQEI